MIVDFIFYLKYRTIAKEYLLERMTYDKYCTYLMLLIEPVYTQNKRKPKKKDIQTYSWF